VELALLVERHHMKALRRQRANTWPSPLISIPF
jgi:hypothetical protein